MEAYLTPESKRRYQKRYYEKNKERILTNQKQYREEHREQIAAYQKRYSMTHDRSEYQRRYWRRKHDKENKEAAV